jgi:hypothetical protein
MKSCCDEYCANHGCNQGRNCPVRIERIREAKKRLDRAESWRVGQKLTQRFLAWLTHGIIGMGWLALIMATVMILVQG